MLTLTTGAEKGELGVRFPHLSVTEHEGTQALVLDVHHDQNKHGPFGYTTYFEDIQLNTPYQVSITLRDQVLTWMINGNEIESYKLNIPLIFEDMKVYLSDPWLKTFPGTSSYLSIIADSK